MHAFMRRLFTGFIFIVLLIAGCERYSRMDVLYELNGSIDTNPDSTLVRLKEMQTEMANDDITEETKAFYGLMLVKTADKAHKLDEVLGVSNKTQTDSIIGEPRELQADTLINRAVTYYERHPESGLLAEAYYYAGRTSTELRNGEKALLYYHKALVKDSIHVSTYLRSRIYAQMGVIYMRNELFADAIQMSELAYFYCQQDSDTLGMRICTETIEDIKRVAQEKDSASSQNQKQLVAMRVLRMNEQLKSDLLNNRNAELQAENQKRKMVTWLIICCVVLLSVISAWFIRRQMIEKKKLYEEMGTVNATKREFYDADIDKIISRHERDNMPLKQTEWTDIEEKLLESFPKFRERLYSHNNFSEQEFRICILIKMGISPSVMSTLLATSKSNITQSRQRMQKKVFNGRGSAKDWDRFILSL